MSSEKFRNIRNFILVVFPILLLSSAHSQNSGRYPQFTKWYQDPLGLKPLQLSTSFGFVWGSASLAACLLFTKADSAFNKKISFFADAGMSLGYKPPFTAVVQTDVGFLYHTRRWMAVGIEWNIFHFKDYIDDTYAFGLTPLGRFYPYGSKKLKLFFEYGAGLSFSLRKFPMTGTGKDADTGRVGTKFNLTSKYGAGIEFDMNKKFSLQSVIRHFHLSNGNIKGIERNPSHDSNGLFIGVIYKFFP
jgi:hypothetical protein